MNSFFSSTLGEFVNTEYAETPDEVLARLREAGKTFCSVYAEFAARRDGAFTTDLPRRRWIEINNLAIATRNAIVAVNRGLDLGNNFVAAAFAQNLFQLIPDFSVRYMRSAIVVLTHANGLMRSFVYEIDKVQIAEKKASEAHE